MFGRKKRKKRQRGEHSEEPVTAAPEPAPPSALADDPTVDEVAQADVDDVVADEAGVRDLLASGDRLGFDPEVVVFDRPD